MAVLGLPRWLLVIVGIVLTPFALLVLVIAYHVATAQPTPGAAAAADAESPDAEPSIGADWVPIGVDQGKHARYAYVRVEAIANEPGQGGRWLARMRVIPPDVPGDYVEGAYDVTCAVGRGRGAALVQAELKTYTGHIDVLTIADVAAHIPPLPVPTTLEAADPLVVRVCAAGRRAR